MNEALEAVWKGIEFARTQNGDTEVVAEAIIYYCSICADSGQTEFIEKARKMLAEIRNAVQELNILIQQIWNDTAIRLQK